MRQSHRPSFPYATLATLPLAHRRARASPRSRIAAVLRSRTHRAEVSRRDKLVSASSDDYFSERVKFPQPHKQNATVTSAHASPPSFFPHFSLDDRVQIAKVIQLVTPWPTPGQDENAPLAQLVEQLTLNQRVYGSNP